MTSPERVNPFAGVQRVTVPTWARLKFGLQVYPTAVAQIRALPPAPHNIWLYDPKSEELHFSFQLWL